MRAHPLVGVSGCRTARVRAERGKPRPICTPASPRAAPSEHAELLAELLSRDRPSLVRDVASRRLNVASSFLSWLAAQPSSDAVEALGGDLVAALAARDADALLAAAAEGDDGGLSSSALALSQRWSALAARGLASSEQQASLNAASRAQSAAALTGRAPAALGAARSALRPSPESRILAVLLPLRDGGDRAALLAEALTPPPEPGPGGGGGGEDAAFEADEEQLSTTPLRLLAAVDAALRGADAARDAEALGQLRAQLIERL